MTTIIDSIRKHQKMIVLGAALAVITLYMIPVDQIAAQLGPRSQAMETRLQHIADRLFAKGLISQGYHMIDVKNHVVKLLEDHGL